MTTALGDSLPEDVLRACAVRIHLGLTHVGSGFFAAPGVVITCRHVVGPLDATSRVAAADLSVFDVEGGVYSVIDLRLLSHQDLLSLMIAPGNSHPCAPLGGVARMGDQVGTFGYPERHPEGVPTLMWADGPTGDRRYMKLSGGQVQPGMSGAPVMSLTTGAVCGILKSTRDRTQALGGYAIPIELLLQADPKLERANQRSQEPASRTAKGGPAAHAPTAQPSGPSVSHHVFVVTVARQGSEWTVTAVEYPDGAPIQPAPVDFTKGQPILEAFRFWGRRGRGYMADEARRFGGVLTDMFLPGEIGVRLARLIAAPEPVQLALSFGSGMDEDLEHLPWEHLYLPDRGDAPAVHFARDDALSFVRTPSIASVPQRRRLPVDRPLEILLVHIDPAAAWEHEPSSRPVEDVCTAFVEMANRLNQVHLTAVAITSATELEDVVATGSFDIVHYVGFARWADGLNELALGAHRGVRYVSPILLAHCLERGVPSLVVLQLCEGPEELVPGDLSVFARPLLVAGAEAVVGFQTPLSAAANRHFNEQLYAELARGVSLDLAVQSARRRLWMAEPYSGDFLSPATFLSAPGELRLVADAPRSRTRVGAIGAYA